MVRIVDRRLIGTVRPATMKEPMTDYPKRYIRPAIGPVNAKLLGVLARYYYLTAVQVTRLLYAPTSLTYVQARLKLLADAGYLQRVFLPRPTRTGSAPLVYTLARKGLNAVREMGQEIPARYRPAEVRELSYLHLVHTLALNDLLIALELLARADPRLEIAELRHERTLKLEPVSVQLPTGATAAVIPDAWLDLRIARRYQECYCLELDRGTTGQKAWRRKIAALLAYVDGPYQETFGTESVTIAVVATPGATRRDELLQWTEAELQAEGRRAQADVFRFSVLDVESAPAELFLARRWLEPFQRTPVALLELDEGASPP